MRSDPNEQKSDELNDNPNSSEQAQQLSEQLKQIKKEKDESYRKQKEQEASSKEEKEEKPQQNEHEFTPWNRSKGAVMYALSLHSNMSVEIQTKIIAESFNATEDLEDFFLTLDVLTKKHDEGTQGLLKADYFLIPEIRNALITNLRKHLQLDEEGNIAQNVLQQFNDGVLLLCKNHKMSALTALFEIGGDLNPKQKLSKNRYLKQLSQYVLDLNNGDVLKVLSKYKDILTRLIYYDWHNGSDHLLKLYNVCDVEQKKEFAECIKLLMSRAVQDQDVETIKKFLKHTALIGSMGSNAIASFLFNDLLDIYKTTPELFESHLRDYQRLDYDIYLHMLILALEIPDTKLQLNSKEATNFITTALSTYVVFPEITFFTPAIWLAMASKNHGYDLNNLHQSYLFQRYKQDSRTCASFKEEITGFIDHCMKPIILLSDCINKLSKLKTPYLGDNIPIANIQKFLKTILSNFEKSMVRNMFQLRKNLKEEKNIMYMSVYDACISLINHRMGNPLLLKFGTNNDSNFLSKLFKTEETYNNDGAIHKLLKDLLGPRYELLMKEVAEYKPGPSLQNPR